jgi:hypothetical protein
MRLDVLRKELEKLLKTKYEFEPRFEEDGDSLVAKCNIKIRDIDDGVFLRIIAFESGSCAVTFVFDKIELTMEVLLRINAFNEGVHWFKAYVNEGGFLTFKHPIADAIVEANVIETVEFLFGILTKDETRKYLEPLTELTYSE